MLVTNAHVYCVDDHNDTATAFAVRSGKIVAVGNTKEFLEQYTSFNTIDLKGQYVYPGFNDAHAHFYGLGQFMQMVDLTGTKSWNEVVERCKEYYSKHKADCIIGRGWDQNDWEVKEFPTNDELNNLFPDIPVFLKRIDGHAAVVNDKLLTLANINAGTKILGGEVVINKNKPTGVLIDNAADMAQRILPEASLEEKIKALNQAEKICFENGLTSVCDAGLDRSTIELIDSLQKAGALSIRVYAMISMKDTNVDYYLARVPYKTEKLNVCSFKMYADGALGSRGACLLQPYNDKKDHYGFLLTEKEKMESYIKRIAGSKYQLNTHCIGDSADKLVLNLYAKYLKGKNDRRWRIEHAQVVNEKDFDLYGQYNIIPSVQPTHATSDMYWAGDRIGKERLKYAYAYKKLLQQNGWLPLGTDFPIEYVNPFYTFYSAVARKDGKGFPPGGFQMEDALTRQEALLGMTVWPAKAAFEENEKGSIEPGKFADFIVLDVDLVKDDLVKIRNAKVKATFVGGQKVY